MKKSHVVLFLFAFLSLLTVPAVFGQSQDNLIQLAVLLDTSNSMDGLIGKAKSQLWSIVNALSRSSRRGSGIRLEVSLYEYGKSSIPEGEHYLRMVVPFTTDLDLVSERLFQLTTNGGDEYCGAVINSAVRNLRWSGRDDALKMIFIAGNEPFNQGRISYRRAIQSAASRGITVNTIFCGSYSEGVETYWEDGAVLSGGSYASIDQDETVYRIEAPQDSRIIELGSLLNSTYLPYGSRKVQEERKELQVQQDRNARSMGAPSMVERSVSKSSEIYRNSGWDLVDAYTADRNVLRHLDEAELPPELQQMSPAQREAYIREKAAEREAIQKEISELDEARERYIAGALQTSAETESLDTKIISSIRKQAEEKNFVFK